MTTVPSFPYIRISGSAKERGQQYGQAAHKEIRRSLDIYRPAFEKKNVTWSLVRDHSSKLAEQIQISDPVFYQELKGIADGSDLPIEDIIVINARTELLYGIAQNKDELDDGCTGAVALPGATKGPVLHGQTWDWRSECLNSTIILHSLPDDGPEFITLVEAGGLARCGMNSAGIAITGNFLKCEHDTGVGGIPLSFIRRRALASKSYAAAISTVIDSKVSFSNNIILSSAEGDAINFEKTPVEAFWIVPENDLIAHSNHFASPTARAKVQDLSITICPDSLYRDRMVRRTLEANTPHVTIETFKEAFADDFGSPHSVCCPPRPDGVGGSEVATVAAVIMDTKAGEMHVAAAPYSNHEYVTYRLETMKS